MTWKSEKRYLDYNIRLLLSLANAVGAGRMRQAMRELVTQAGENDNISTVYVVDDADKFYGAIDLKDLIIARETDELDGIISTSYPYVTDHEKIDNCIETIKDYAERFSAGSD